MHRPMARSTAGTRRLVTTGSCPPWRGFTTALPVPSLSARAFRALVVTGALVSAYLLGAGAGVAAETDGLGGPARTAPSSEFGASAPSRPGQNVPGLSGSSAPAAHSGFTLLSADAGLIEIEHRLPPEPYGAGSRAVVTTWLAIPPDARARAQMTVLAEEPAAWVDQLEESARKELLASIDPETELLGRPTTMRNQHVVALRHAWLRRGPDGSLRQVTRARFSIAIEGGAQGRRSSGADAFEGLYQSLLLNYEQGKSWRIAPPQAQPLRGTDYFSSTSAPWIKVWCDHEDIYAIEGADLERLGIDLEEIDPLTLRMFTPLQTRLQETVSVEDAPSWMTPLAIHLVGMEDGRFDTGDRILFLGYGPDTWFTSKGFTQPGLEAYARDPYTNENPYWLTWGGSFSTPPLRMEEAPSGELFEPYVDRVRDRIHLEEDEAYNPRMREIGVGAADWELYWWRERIATQDRDDVSTVTVSIPDPVETEPVSVFARFWGANDSNSRSPFPPPDHDLEFALNGNFIDRRTWEGHARQDFRGEGNWLVPGDTQVFLMTIHGHLDNTIQRLDQINLAFIDLEYTRRLRARNDQIAFFPGGLSGVQSFAVRGFGGDDVLVVDATDSANPVLVPGVAVAEEGATTIRFRASADPRGSLPARFVLRRESALGTPRLERDQQIAGGYLRERTDPVQMIILTHPLFDDAAERLAQYRRTHFPDRENAEVTIVNVDDVYDEFSFGRPDPVAIRNFLQWVRHRWNGGNPDDGPAYVVLLGDAHRDYRGKEVANPSNFVPTYNRYFYSGYVNQVYDPRFSSDDFFVLLDLPQDDGLDLFLGRLSCETQTQAMTMVDKIIRYETESAFGPWRDRVTLVADDICQGTSRDGLGWEHLRQTEVLADNIFPGTIQLDRIYLVEYGAECAYTNKPDVANALLRSMNDGTLVVNFTGHGSESQIADERIFETSSVGSLTNSDRLFLFLTASCSVGKFDVTTPSLAEALMRHPNGGSIAVFSASSVASSSGNAGVNQRFFSKMFPGGDVTRVRPIGEAAVEAKIAGQGDLNELRFALHGDPAVRLLTARSKIDLITTVVATGEAYSDTLQRGALTELSGRVLDEMGEVRSDFDGQAIIQVYDSEVARVVIDPQRVTPVRYELSGVPIFRGTARVTNGEFRTLFQVPSALRTGPRGPAQIYVYAHDGQRDALGALPELFVPETVPAPSSDQTGPSITLSLAQQGDFVSPGAEITATLFDSSGVNVTGLVPSRAVIFRIEEEGEVLLAEDLSNLVTFGDDFRSGELRHRLPGSLVPGRRYDAVLEASDNVNNRSSVRTSFSLSGSGATGFQLGRVFNLPNPTEQHTHFLGELSEEAFVEVEIFTLSGRRIMRIPEQRMTPDRFANMGIGWDGRDADGDRLSNGVYLYKVTARPVRGGASRDRIERLVVSR